jgi:hypothetical protein
MATNLTEVASFDPTVTVPEGTDSRVNAAERVTALAQVLANRSRFLKGITDIAALTTAANTFTDAPQTIDIANDPSVPLITTTKTAFDYSANPSNGWKLIGRFPTDGGGRNFNLYVGANDSSGTFALVVNAFWQIGSSGSGVNKWHQEDATKDSFGMFVVAEVLTLSSQAAGASAWGVWPTNRGGISSPTYVGDVIYKTPLVRGPTPIDLAFASGPYIRDVTDGSVFRNPDTTGWPSSQRIVVPLRVPVGSTLGIVQIRHAQGTTMNDIFRLYKRAGAFGTGLTFTQVGTDSVPGGSGIATLTSTLDPGGHVVAAGEELQIEWQLTDIGSVTALSVNKIIAMRMSNWTDIGPSNYY